MFKGIQNPGTNACSLNASNADLLSKKRKFEELDLSKNYVLPTPKRSNISEDGIVEDDETCGATFEKASEGDTDYAVESTSEDQNSTEDENASEEEITCDNIDIEHTNAASNINPGTDVTANRKRRTPESTAINTGVLPKRKRKYTKKKITRRKQRRPHEHKDYKAKMARNSGVLKEWVEKNLYSVEKRK